MRKSTRYLSLLLAVALCLSLVTPALAAEKATTVQLSRTEGTVTITNAGGKSVKTVSKMKLYNGYHIKTGAKSYAWITLDSTKLVKLDASSELELRKSGKKLELMVVSGSIYFNVTEKLASDETLNVCTSTMVAGVRGTSGVAQVIDPTESRVLLFSGQMLTCGTNPITGEVKRTLLTAGNMATVTANVESEQPDDEQPGTAQPGDDKRPAPQDEGVDIDLKPLDKKDVDGFALVDIVSDKDTVERIKTDWGEDFSDVTEQQASERLRQDEQEAAEAQAAVDEKLKREEQQREQRTGEVERHRPVWGDDNAAETDEPETTVSSSGGGSGPVSYTVSFMDGDKVLVTRSVVSGGVVAQPSGVTKTGYSLLGWYKDSAFGELWDFSSEKITGSTKIYSKWDPLQYAITFDPNYTGAEVSQPVNCYYDDKYPIPAQAPTRTGHRFAGWFTAADGGDEVTAETDMTTASDHTIYAHWTPHGYKVTGATAGTDYTYENGVLTLLTNAGRNTVNITLDSGVSSTADSIVVSADSVDVLVDSVDTTGDITVGAAANKLNDAYITVKDSSFNGVIRTYADETGSGVTVALETVRLGSDAELRPSGGAAASIVLNGVTGSGVAFIDSADRGSCELGLVGANVLTQVDGGRLVDEDGGSLEVAVVQDLYVASGTLKVTGSVMGELTVDNGNVTLDSGSTPFKLDSSGTDPTMEGALNADLTLLNSTEVAEGKTLTVLSGKKLTMDSSGIVLDNNGRIENKGTIICDKLVNGATGEVHNQGTLDPTVLKNDDGVIFNYIALGGTVSKDVGLIIGVESGKYSYGGFTATGVYNTDFHYQYDWGIIVHGNVELAGSSAYKLGASADTPSTVKLTEDGMTIAGLSIDESASLTLTGNRALMLTDFEFEVGTLTLNGSTRLHMDTSFSAVCARGIPAGCVECYEGDKFCLADASQAITVTMVEDTGGSSTAELFKGTSPVGSKCLPTKPGFVAEVYKDSSYANKMSSSDVLDKNATIYIKWVSA